MGVPINGQILAWARKRSHLSLEEVATKAEQSVETIESWEKELDTPTYPQLEKLAYSIYKRPIAIFFLPTPPDEKIESSFRTLPDGDYSKLPSPVERAIRTARVFQLNLYELHNGSNPNQERLSSLLGLRKDSSASSLPVRVRDFLGVSIEAQFGWSDADDAFKNWRRNVEATGIFIFKAPFRDDSFSGFCLYDSEFPIIYVNNSMAKARQIFTVFHELAHIILQTSGLDPTDQSYFSSLPEPNAKIEAECNAFAGNFLVPVSALRNQLKVSSPTEDDIKTLARKFNVSRQVILRRLYDMGKVAKARFEKLDEQWAKEFRDSSPSSGGNFYRNKVAYLGDSYISLVLKRYYSTAITQEQAVDYLNIKLNQLAGLETLAVQ